MQIVSINAAQPATVEFNGDTVPTGIFKVPVQGKVPVTRYGIQGDTIVDQNVHGGLDQAIYLYHLEDYQWWSEQLGKPLTPGLFGENLTLSGLADITLVIGDRLTIGTVELEITAPRTPCFKLAARMGDSGFAKKFAQAQRPGAYARVIHEGELQVGDNITLWQTAEDFASVVEVFVEWHKKDRSVEVLKRALASPIAIVHREKLQQWHDESIK